MMLFAVTEKGKNMRLIDADELYAHSFPYCIDDDGYEEAVDDVISIIDIDRAPTITDVVPKEKYDKLYKTAMEMKELLREFEDEI